jgi:hypothetical protein
VIRVPWAMPLGIAYREWLLELAKAEAEAGCPRLFAMKSDNAMYFADLTKDWSGPQRRDLLCARVKWLFNKNYGYAQSELTDAERTTDSHWDYPFFGRNLGLGAFRSPGKAAVEIARPSGRQTVVDADKVEAVRRLDRLELGEFKIDRKRLRQAIKDAMRPAFGVPEAVGAGWRYRAVVAGLEVATNLDFRGRAPSQFRYSQWIHLQNGQKREWLLDHGGISTLLGWPQTEWRYLTDADIPSAAELLVRLCTEFVEGVSGMWERSGLGAETSPG